MPPPEGQRQCSPTLVSPFAWICGIAAALCIRYGYYGNYKLVMGPHTSRMLTTNSVFVEQVQVRAQEKNGPLLLYGFEERPEPSLETNWTVSERLFVDAYGRRGFSMWLNRGSRIRMAWDVAHGGGKYEEMLAVLIKGEENVARPQTDYTSSSVTDGDCSDEPQVGLTLSDGQLNIWMHSGRREAECTLAGDDSYYFGLVNLTPRSIAARLEVNVSSKKYDTSEATSLCAMSNGVCKLRLLFPSTQYYVLATPDSDASLRAWHVELSFVSRLTAYFLVTVSVMVIVSMVLKHLGVCDAEETTQEQEATERETDPILPRKETPCSYGSNAEGPAASLGCSSEDLHDEKICVICYDENRNCFFTPCGHNATCHTCAKRIMKAHNKVCPICRRLIQKVRRFPNPQDGLSAHGGS